MAEPLVFAFKTVASCAAWALNSLCAQAVLKLRILPEASRCWKELTTDTLALARQNFKCLYYNYTYIHTHTHLKVEFITLKQI